MAIIKFENSRDLINHLCKEDVLGELEVSFTQEWSNALTPSFNFTYPALDDHLSTIFSEWLEHVNPPSELHVKYENAEDFSAEAIEKSEGVLYNTEKLKEIINDEIRHILDDELEVELDYACIDIEGPDFKVENLKINSFEIEGSAPEENEEALEQVDERIRNLILSSILKSIGELYRNEVRSIECLERIELQLNIHSDELDVVFMGSPNFQSLYDFEDGESFDLDTEFLQTADI